MDPQNVQPQTFSSIPPQPAAVAPAPKKSVGPVIGALIVLLVLILGGLYLWGSKLERDAMNNPPFILGDQNTDAGLPPTSESDEVSAIEADINSTDLATFESEVNADMQAAAGSL